MIRERPACAQTGMSAGLLRRAALDALRWYAAIAWHGAVLVVLVAAVVGAR